MALALVPRDVPVKPHVEFIGYNSTGDAVGIYSANVTVRVEGGGTVVLRGHSKDGDEYAIVDAFKKYLPGVRLDGLTAVPRAGNFAANGYDVSVTLANPRRIGTAHGKGLLLQVARATVDAVGRALAQEK